MWPHSSLWVVINGTHRCSGTGYMDMRALAQYGGPGSSKEGPMRMENRSLPILVIDSLWLLLRKWDGDQWQGSSSSKQCHGGGCRWWVTWWVHSDVGCLSGCQVVVWWYESTMRMAISEQRSLFEPFPCQKLWINGEVLSCKQGKVVG